MTLHHTGNCKYCGTQLLTSSVFYSLEKDGVDREENYSNCPLCGYSSQLHFADLVTSNSAVLKLFDLNSSALGIQEVGTHLKNHFSDIYSLSSRRFEILIKDIFRDYGCEPILTKETRDGGFDIFLVNKISGQIELIIECKRYAEERKIGIAIVQRLTGVAFQWNVKKAVLVTTSHLTTPAKDAAHQILKQGIELDFITATELLGLLQVYNLKLPSLQDLTEDARKNIIKGNLK